MNRFQYRHFIKIFIFALIALFCCNPAWSKSSFVFETIKNQQKLDTSTLVINDIGESDSITVDWIINADHFNRFERYHYDQDFNILSWSVSQSNERTRYDAVIDGKFLMVQGVLKGKEISKKIKIQGLPLYANPKIGLIKGLQSNRKKFEFWAIRNDSLSKVKMIAFHQGIDLILVDGKMVRAHKVYWKCKNVPEYFFNRTYWFRESDGKFIGQQGSNEKKRVLIKEM